MESTIENVIITTCEKHGNYESKFIRELFGKEHRTGCPGCEEQRERWREEQLNWRKNWLAAERIRRADIPARFRNKALDAYCAETTGQRQALAVARDYVAGFREHHKAGRCLIFSTGPSTGHGTGKTLLGCGIGNDLAREGYEVQYMTVADLISEVQASKTILEHLQIVDLLVLDDVGVEYEAQVDTSPVAKILCRRYDAKKPSLIISCLSEQRLSQYLGEHVFSRLLEGGPLSAVFDWENYRAKIRPEVSNVQERTMSNRNTEGAPVDQKVRV